MRIRITSSDVQKRLRNKSDTFNENFIRPSKECDRRYQQYKMQASNYNITRFFNEVAESSSNAVNYIRPCIEILSECDDNNVSSIFKDQILPKLDDYSLNDIDSIEDLNESIKSQINDQIISNKVCDRILNNHEEIMKEYNLDSFIKNSKIDSSLIIERVCSIIDNFKLPEYAKVNCAIEECSYLLEKNGFDYDEPNMVKSIIEYFSLGNELNENQIKSVIESNYCLHEDTFNELNKDDESNSKIKKICNSFILSGEHNPIEISILTTAVLNSSDLDLRNNFFVYLELLRRILIIPQNEELSNYILNEILPNLYNNLYEKFIQNKNSTDTIDFVKNHVLNELNLLRIFIRDYNFDIIIDRIHTYIDKLEELQSDLDSAKDILYPSYNIESMQISTLFESEKINSLQEFKLYKYSNFLNKAKNLSEKVDNLFKPSAIGICNFVERSIIEPESIYDIVNEDGIIDYIISSYSFDSSVDMPNLHKYTTGICKNINESILKDSRSTCYYIMNENSIEFHLKENEAVSLSSKDKVIIESHISSQDIDKMVSIYSTAELLDEDVNLEKDAIDYFKESKNLDMFETFVEACAIAGISKSKIEDIYERILENTNDKIPTIMKHNFVESYQPYEPSEYMIEGLVIAQCIVNEAQSNIVSDKFNNATRTKAAIASNNTNDYRSRINQKLKTYGYEDEDERSNRASQYIDEDDNDDYRPQTSSTSSHEIKKPIRDNTNYEDIQKTGAIKNITFTNMKLYVKGLAKMIKDKTTRGQNAVRMADSAFNQFARSCKAFLISDRREAIIKGSIIPSFHKCVLIAVSLIGLGVLTQNPIIPAITLIGGIAASRKLTKKERVLLLDDIDVELEVINKELAIADANNQLNKYRALLKIKKDLIRQRQRIEYNIRVGKDLLPSGTSLTGDR